MNLKGWFIFKISYIKKENLFSKSVTQKKGKWKIKYYWLREITFKSNHNFLIF